MVRGIEKQIIVKKKTRCGDCEGNKCLKGTLPKRCWTCYGKGVEVIKTGPYLEESVCKSCGGNGMTIVHKCQNCKGHGVILSNYVETLRIHQFVEDGEMLRFEHHGHFAPNSYPGDLFLSVFVEQNPYFSKIGLDLYVKLKVSYAVSVLGGTVKEPLLNGTWNNFSIPCAHHNSTIYIENEGLLDRKLGKRGNKILTFEVQQPDKITEEEMILYSRLSMIGL